MAALECTTVDLLQEAKCLMCFTDTELLAAEVVLRDNALQGGAARSSDELLAAAVAWAQLTQHQRDAIEVRQLCQDAVDDGARDDCDATTLKAELKCYCSLSPSQLEAIISFLKCQQRQ